MSLGSPRMPLGLLPALYSLASLLVPRFGVLPLMPLDAVRLLIVHFLFVARLVLLQAVEIAGSRML